jgi:hypothetical protein
LRERAGSLSPGPERTLLWRKARQAETALRIDAWLGAPGDEAEVASCESISHAVRLSIDMQDIFSSDGTSAIRRPLTAFTAHCSSVGITRAPLLSFALTRAWELSSSLMPTSFSSVQRVYRWVGDF